MDLIIMFSCVVYLFTYYYIHPVYRLYHFCQTFSARFCEQSCTSAWL